MTYDDNNIFAKILREIPFKKIYEDEYVLSFYDINPQKKIHALVIPKGKYINLDDFASKASEKRSALIRGVNMVAKKLQISSDTGKAIELGKYSENGGQHILHFHLLVVMLVKWWNDSVQRNFLELKDLKKPKTYPINKNKYLVKKLILIFINKFYVCWKKHRWIDRLSWSDEKWVNYIKSKFGNL